MQDTQITTVMFFREIVFMYCLRAVWMNVNKINFCQTIWQYLSYMDLKKKKKLQSYCIYIKSDGSTFCTPIVLFFVFF